MLRITGGASSWLLIVLTYGGLTQPRLLPRGAQGAQDASLTVRVVDAQSLRPLANVEVWERSGTAHRLTNERGLASVGWPSGQPAHVRVRQIGYRPAERDISPQTPARDTLTIALERAVFALPEVRTDATSRCATADTNSSRLTAFALEQLQLGAQHFEQFRQAFPFEVIGERRTLDIPTSGNKRLAIGEERETSEKWGDPYRPGEVLHRHFDSYSISLLFITAIADPLFWANHCFVVRGVETRDARRAIRFDFAVAPGVESPDWEGSAWLDSATSMLQRIEFRLTGLDNDRPPRRVEGYSTFRSISPFIAVPDSSMALFWRRHPAADGDWGLPDRVQLLRVKSIEYRGAIPPPP